MRKTILENKVMRTLIQKIIAYIFISLIGVLCINAELYAQGADPGYDDYCVDIKFIESSEVRLTEEGLVSEAGYDMEPFLNVIRLFYPWGEQWWWFAPLFERPIEFLEAEHTQAEQISGLNMPNLTLFFRLYFADPVNVKELISRLNPLEIVEYACQVPLPMPSPSPDYTYQQGYLQSPLVSPAGISGGLDIQYARNFFASNGTWMGDLNQMITSQFSIDIVDIEHDWNTSHEDISWLYGGTPLLGYSWRRYTNQIWQSEIDHGTAVTGLLCAQQQPQNFGIRGMAPQANLILAGTLWWYTGYNVANSVNAAQASCKPGGIILVMQQIAGPNFSGGATQFGLVPPEWNPPIYAAILTATTLGYVVVEPAGNGQQNLDSSQYQTFYPFGFNPFNRSQNNSGAIMVGAGTSACVPETFTNYGSRLDLHAWGSGIVTSGYGDLYRDPANPSDQNQWYTSTFGGTCGASTLIAGCAAMLQSIHLVENGLTVPPLTTQQMLQRLLRRATPQASSSKNIGPRPNMRGVLESYISGFIFNDLNSNGIRDTGEPLINRDMTVDITDPRGNNYNFTCRGSYTFPLYNEWYTITITPDPIDRPYLQQTCPASPGSYQTFILSGRSYSGLDFGFQVLGQLP
jgi:serine protease